MSGFDGSTAGGFGRSRVKAGDGVGWGSTPQDLGDNFGQSRSNRGGGFDNGDGFGQSRPFGGDNGFRDSDKPRRGGDSSGQNDSNSFGGGFGKSNWNDGENPRRGGGGFGKKPSENNNWSEPNGFGESSNGFSSSRRFGDRRNRAGGDDNDDDGGGGGFRNNNNNNNRFKKFGDNDFEDREDKPPPNNYVPVIRDLDELYKEDADHAENYRQVVDDDDEIHISGPNVNLKVVADNWSDTPFVPTLLKNIVDRSKYVRPRKIQAHVIPIVLEGRDVKGHAETGSGKTAAFMLPIIHMLMNENDRTREPLSSPAPFVIIMEPTRELCCQVFEQGLKFANETGVSVAKAYGQYSMRENLSELHCGCDILCATPGRLKHLIQSNLISVGKLKYLVLDEADTLLESNFLTDLREIISAPDFPDKENRQTMLFSATFPEAVQMLSADVLKEDCVMISNKKMVAANSKVIQQFLPVNSYDKKQKLLELLEQELEEAKKKDNVNPAVRRTLVFVKTKRDADLVSLFLCEKSIRATTINGDRSQILREKALRDFRNKEVSVLVSTDVCARGIDIKDLDHVINMDLPMDAVTYVHRIGRTGRLKTGLATSFFDDSESNDINIAKDLVRFMKDVDQNPPDFLLQGAGLGEFGDGNNFEQNNDSPW